MYEHKNKCTLLEHDIPVVCLDIYKRSHGMYCSIARHDITTSNSASFFLRGSPYCLCLGGDMLYSSINIAYIAYALLARKRLDGDAHFFFLGSSCSDSVLVILEIFDWRIAWPPPLEVMFLSPAISTASVPSKFTWLWIVSPWTCCFCVWLSSSSIILKFPNG